MREDFRSVLMKKRFSIPLIVTVFFVAFVGGTQFNHLISGDNIYEQLSKFKDVLSLTEKYYVEDVDTQNLTEHAITGLLNELDPHSVYIKAQQMQRVTEDFQGRFEGIGVEFSIVNDTITVVQPIGGGPSASLGIMSNDKIVRIDGKSSIGFTTDQVMKSLKGPKGTKVSVSIARSGVKELLEFEIVRDVIPLYSVDVSTMLNDKVGYVNVTRFAETTSKEMFAALQKLKSQGMKQLVLDLRSNPGGYLDQAVKMADLFLESDAKGGPRKVVYTLSRKTEFNEEYFAYTNSEFEKIPLIILLSNGSASASEIVSGAIQDWDRGLIVGETSFGKGLVQKQFPLSDGSALRLTISRYYTPSGRLIQRSYANKDKYQEEAFTRDEQEGENIEHKESTADTSRPKFKTAGGRVILGGGGITPDFIVKPDSPHTLYPVFSGLPRTDTAVGTETAGPVGFTKGKILFAGPVGQRIDQAFLHRGRRIQHGLPGIDQGFGGQRILGKPGIVTKKTAKDPDMAGHRPPFVAGIIGIAGQLQGNGLGLLGAGLPVDQPENPGGIAIGEIDGAPDLELVDDKGVQLVDRFPLKKGNRQNLPQQWRGGKGIETSINLGFDRLGFF